MSSARQRLDDLARQGVSVASGRGSLPQRALCTAALSGVPAVLAVIVLDNPRVWVVAPLAIAAVDLLSGLVHWVFDCHVCPGPGRLGSIAVNFLDHHVHPGRSAEVGFCATSWRVAGLATGPLLALALLLPAGWAQAWVFWLGALALVVAQAHKEAHKRHPARIVVWLQRCRFILPPAAHRAHHRDHGRAYCVFTGWCNPLLDHCGVWRCGDRMVGALRGRSRARG